MFTKSLMLAALLASAYASPALAEGETLLCVGELSTGFRLDGKNWTIAKFNTDKDRYVVKPVKLKDYSGSPVNYEVTQLGEQYAIHECFRAEGNAGIEMVCGGLGMGFIVNFKTLRYQETYGIGYLDGEDKPGNTPAISIGKCSPLNP